MLVEDGKGKPDPSARTIGTMTWESLSCLVSEHWKPQVRQVRGSPGNFGLSLLWNRDCSSSVLSSCPLNEHRKGFPGQLKRKIKILCLLSGQWLPVISANSKVERKRNFHVCKQLHLQVGAKLGWSGHLSSFMTGWLTEKPPQSLKLLNWWITSAEICQIYVFMNFICLGMRVLKWIF